MMIKLRKPISYTTVASFDLFIQQFQDLCMHSMLRMDHRPLDE